MAGLPDVDKQPPPRDMARAETIWGKGWNSSARALARHPAPVSPSPSAEEPPAPPESPPSTRPWPGLDRLGFTQSLGGLALGLIALFSSYDHLTFAGRTLHLQRQWGIPFIAASVAIIFVGCVPYSAPLGRDAQLATGSRLRAAQDAQRAADEANRRENEADRERNRADRDRNRADQERNRAAEARERQAQTAQRQIAALDLLRRSALLSARVQLDPSPIHRDRLQAFLTLMSEGLLEAADE